MTARVLVVEEQISWRERIADALSNAAIEYVVAVNRPEAIDRLADENLEVVCMHWSLGDFNEGRELLRYIRENRSDVRVILMSVRLAGEMHTAYETSRNLIKQYLPIIHTCFGRGDGVDVGDELVTHVRNILDNPQVRWGHISDLHIELDDYNQDRVLETLTSDISDFAPLDFMVVSGDITHSGSTEEFIKARTFLNSLLDNTGLDKKQLFLVPGNHDVNWGVIKEFVNGGARSILNSASNLASFFTSAKYGEDRHRLFERLANYMKFTEEYFDDLPEKHLTLDRYFHNETLRKNGFGNISISSLNSAWSSAIHFDMRKRKADDDRKIMIGSHQVDESIRFIVREKSHMNFLVIHHPDDWLPEFDRKRCWDELANKYHVILHGHEHRPKAQKSPYGSAMTIGVGAASQNDVTEGDDGYYNSHNRYYVSEVAWNSGHGRQFLRKFSAEARRWISDIETAPDVGPEVGFEVDLASGVRA